MSTKPNPLSRRSILRLHRWARRGIDHCIDRYCLKHEEYKRARYELKCIDETVKALLEEAKDDCLPTSCEWCANSETIVSNEWCGDIHVCKSCGRAGADLTKRIQLEAKDE